MNRRNRIWIPEAPHLILRPHKLLELHTPPVRLEGIFEVELIHARTGMVTKHLRFKNLIVNAGLDAAGTERITSILAYCAVGTGSAVPTATDVGLASELARSNANGGVGDTSGYDSAGGYKWGRRTRVFTQAQANGNLTEVGMFRNATGTPMWSRALFVDGAGNPTTITKTDEYELRVTYELRVHHDVGDTIYSATVNGAAMDITTRAARAGSTDAFGATYGDTTGNVYYYDNVFTGNLGTVTGEPGGTIYRHSSGSYQPAYSPYSSGNYYRDLVTSWGATEANATLKCYCNSNSFSTTCYQHSLATAQTKSNTQKLEIGVRMSWARYP